VAHLALYRKYRSQTFSQLVGQDHVVQTLKKAVATGKVAHAYLFTGPRGTGKTSTARLLAKALNCPNIVDGEPCGVCDVCTSISDGSAMDVVELDAASESGVDDVREKIVEAVEYQPAFFQKRIFIIDEVHDLSTKAFDALLKTIEEPPPHIVFVLATTEFSKVPPTIRSRCQRFEFHRGSLHDLAHRLEEVARMEGAEWEPAALSAIAKMADGGYRDALTLLEQAILTSNGPITLAHVQQQLGLIGDDVSDRLLKAMAGQNHQEIMVLTEEIYRKGRDPRSILEALLHRLSDLTRAFYGLEGVSHGDAAAEAALRSQAAVLGPQTLLSFRSQLAEAHRVIRDVSLPRIWLEAELIRISFNLIRQESAPAPATARPETAPRPAPAKREASAPQERPAREEPPAAAPVESPAVSAAPASKEEVLWQEVVKEMCAVSETARRHLDATRVLAVQDRMVTVGFARIPVFDSFMEKNKLRASTIDLWKKKAGADIDLVFVSDGSGLKLTSVAEVSAVELPLDGPRLVEAVKDVFQSDKP
jgi:DNA polymerase III subunit gamma/tau